MHNSPAQVHPLIEDVEEKEELVSTLYGGTIEMREAGIKYLPQEPGETTANYANRLARSVLFPAYKQAVKANTGKLYTKDVVVSNETEQMAEFLKEVDEEDNDLTEFAKQATENAINNGCSYILVDYPPMNDNATLADEIAAGGRPYWVNIKQTQLIEASPVRKGGKRVLGIFRFMEQIAHRVDDFTVKFIEQIKQFSFDENGFVIYSIYRKDETNTWYLYDQGQLIAANGAPFEEIPIVAINLDPVGFFVGQPVFYDLAEENKQHWQMASDYNNIVHHSQVPMLKITGLAASYDDAGNRNNAVVISPNTVLDFGDPNANAEWIEVSGNAAKVGESALAASIRRMAVMSLQLLVNSDANATATASKIDATESMSILQSIGKKTEQALDKAIAYTYKYMGITDQSTTVELNLDDAIIFGDANDVTSLINMYEVGLLSKPTTLKEFQRRGTISESVDITKEESVVVPPTTTINGSDNVTA